jgi:3-oxoacyl-(acyl-carrier-protein) synthase
MIRVFVTQVSLPHDRDVNGFSPSEGGDLLSLFRRDRAIPLGLLLLAILIGAIHMKPHLKKRVKADQTRCHRERVGATEGARIVVLVIISSRLGHKVI